MAGNGNSGRFGTPAALKLLQGNRGRENVGALLAEVASPAVPVQAPPMPDVLSAEAIAEWEQLTPALIALGLVSNLRYPDIQNRRAANTCLTPTGE